MIRIFRCNEHGQNSHLFISCIDCLNENTIPPDVCACARRDPVRSNQFEKLEAAKAA